MHRQGSGFEFISSFVKNNLFYHIKIKVTIYIQKKFSVFYYEFENFCKQIRMFFG